MEPHRSSFSLWSFEFPPDARCAHIGRAAIHVAAILDLPFVPKFGKPGLHRTVRPAKALRDLFGRHVEGNLVHELQNALPERELFLRSRVGRGLARVGFLITDSIVSIGHGSGAFVFGLPGQRPGRVCFVPFFRHKTRFFFVYGIADQGFLPDAWLKPVGPVFV